MRLEKIRCPECKQFFDTSEKECECGWKISDKKNSADWRCDFEKRDGSEPSCLNRGIVSWGNPDGEGFFMCDESKRNWANFEKIFWMGKKVICEKHYDMVRYK